MENETNKVSGMEVEKQYSERPVRHIVTVASMATGISFVWALQLSLLTPYVQLLGIPHAWAAYIWLCGPISGMVVQPVVGYYSDRCTSRHGRRRPFIVMGVAMISVAVFIIGYAADMGRLFGDPQGSKTSKTRAIVIFVIGFWVLDVANNMVQGPCRAFLGDLSENNQARTRIANGFFSLFMAVGNILGYAAGSFKRLHDMFPFTVTHACDIYCANLKTCFFLAILMLLTLSLLTVLTVPEEQFCPPKAAKAGGQQEEKAGPMPFFGEIFAALKGLPRPMWILLLVSALNWIGFFPFLLYDTDWMGREVYGGKVGEGKMYDTGVRAGSLALMLNSLVLGLTSLLMQLLSARGVGVGGGGKRLWGFANFFLSICLAMTVLITKLAQSSRRYPALGGPGVDPLPPTTGVKVGAFALFAVLGIPFSLISIVPYALASIFSATSDTGQGLSMGVLNLSVCIPQMLVSVLSGPWDALFGGGNLPAFVVGAIAAAASGVLALTILPSPQPETRPAAKDSSIEAS